MDDLYFNKCFKQHYKELLGFACKMLEDLEEAKDICADAFLKVYGENNIKPDSIRAYLFTTVRRLCLDFIKARNVRRRDHKIMAKLEDDFVDAMEIKADLIGCIMAQIEKLPASRRRVFIKWINGETTNEIAEQLKISVNTVRVQTQRSIIAIIESLGVTKKNKELTSEQQAKRKAKLKLKYSREHTRYNAYN